ncbi:hypothetical protein Trydic_g3734 [Trypoxylus dichotomus]
MSSYPNTEVLSLIKELVSKLTNFKEGSNLFNHVESYVANCIHNADSMVFLKKNDIDRAVASLSDKYIFHGFSLQANDLLRYYENFLPNSTPKNLLEIKLNIVKFLLCLAENPTSKFLENPYRLPVVHHDEEIDWPAYLKEGIERWSPPPEESSDNWSETSESDLSNATSPQITAREITKVITVDEIDSGERDTVNYDDWKESGQNSVQSSWFLKDQVCVLPRSSNIDANIAICWDNFLEHSVQGLISIKRSNIITEYCILREIIWQNCIVHNSFIFYFVGNKLLPRENVTIASVRASALQTFLYEFLPYIELLHDFRSFHSSLFDEKEHTQAPDTYRSYNNSLRGFLKPLFDNLVRIEKEIIEQKSMMTLLRLANEFKDIFTVANILKYIHHNSIIDFRNNEPLICATTLLYRLHYGLLHCTSKIELDIYLTLYLESLFKYFAIINTWVGNDTLIDYYDEFIVKQVNTFPNVTMDVTDFTFTSVFAENSIDHENFDWDMGFVIREMSEIFRNDSVFHLIYTEVLQIGKNIHFLRLLKKLYLLEDTLDNESLYDELISRFLREISSYFEHPVENGQNELALIDNKIELEEFSFKFPAICPDSCKYPTEMDKLGNLLDTNDGFLMTAFKSYFVEAPQKELRTEKTLYEKISGITKTVYPAKQILDRVLSQILRDRYSQSGYLVKTILIEDFQMQKHFELLRHLFLFKDDIIFPLYRRLFVQMIDKRRFDNDIWLTAQLHDIMLDLYPNFYEKCVVKVVDSTQVLDDPLRACELIDINYIITWPVNLIIGERHLEMYSELFRLILKVKWALYTLNHLYFNEIESANSKTPQPKTLKLFLRRLKVFRFHLLNEFSNIQHYILGYVFSKFLRRFELDFEAAYNLDTLISSHSNFINSVYNVSMDFKRLHEKTHGFNLLLYIVRKFNGMWRNVKEINEKELLKYEEMFMKCRDNLDPVIFPRDMLMDS